MENDFLIQQPTNASLKTWVDYYFFIDIPTSALKLQEEYAFPFPRITFGYFFEHPFLITNHSIKESIRANMVISRVSTNQISVQPQTDRVKIIGAHLKPYALGLLTDEAIIDQPWVIKTEALFKREAIRFKETITNCDSPKEMFSTIESSFLRTVRERDLSTVIQAVALIEAAKGNITIATVSESIGVSTRTLRNHFYKSIGCSPKDYLILVKLRQSIYQMKHSTDTLTAVSYEQYFADQAHFTHTIKNITGASPKAIREKLPDFRFLQF